MPTLLCIFNEAEHSNTYRARPCARGSPTSFRECVGQPREQRFCILSVRIRASAMASSRCACPRVSRMCSSASLRHHCGGVGRRGSFPEVVISGGDRRPSRPCSSRPMLQPLCDRSIARDRPSGRCDRKQHHALENFDQDAFARYTIRRAMFDQAGDDVGATWSLVHEGDVRRGQHQLEVASRLSSEALERFQRLGPRLGVSSAHEALGHVAREERAAAPMRSGTQRKRSLLHGNMIPARVSRILEAISVLFGESGDARVP